MFLLLFFVFLIQFFTYWVFEPFASFLEYVLEIRMLPIIALVGLPLEDINKLLQVHNLNEFSRLQIRFEDS